MPATLTLENIPDDIYERLRATAAMHRRSPGSEAIASLETLPAPTRMDSGERLVRARQLRAGLSAKFRARDIDVLKKQGRS